jgi:cytochrome c oxidase subunit 2
MTPPVRAKLLVLVGVPVAALLFVATATGDNGGFAPVPPESPNAEGITQSYWFITAFVLAIFVLVEALLVVFVVRYRRRRRDRGVDGAQIHGSTRLELLWTAGPVLVLFAIAVFVFVKLPGISDVPASSTGSLEVDVSGRQFYWQYEYPNGVVVPYRLRAPVGEVVELTVTAPEWDVIHSWWIPALGGKIDAIPGRTNRTWFQAAREGVFRGQCAELCGLNHARMLAEVEVLPRAEFDAWLETEAAAQRAGTSSLGEETWRAACATCHGLAGEGGAAAGAPRLAGSARASDAVAIENVVRNGRNLMPPLGRDWSDRQMDALTAYMREELAGGG